jgi:uncharacterized repeat protein (TIGR01451 family)
LKISYCVLTLGQTDTCIMSFLSTHQALRLFFLGLLFSSFNLLYAQNAATFDGYLAERYFQLELQLIKTGVGFTPPVASRAIGYTGLALYESVVPGIPTYKSTDGILNGLGPNAITNPGTNPYHWPTVANNALGTLIDSLFGNANPTNKQLIRDLKDSFNMAFSTQVVAATYSNSVIFGSVIAADVFAYSKTDGGHQGYANNFPTSYVIPTGLGYWVPTPPGLSLPLQPYWGNNRPFMAENVIGDSFVGANPPFSTTVGSSFYNDALEVYNVTSALTAEQTNIALYWADGGNTVTPPGHSMSILIQLSVQENFNLEKAVLAFSKLAMSQTDAFICCWKTKYAYNLMRPITYIKANIDANWNSLIVTPPFPEYTSGHSTQSGAMESVMTGIFGVNYGFTDYTNGTSFGGPRSFTDFGEAADEAAISRLYGGIHYQFSNQIGVENGNKLGNNINKLYATQLRLNPMADVELKADYNRSVAYKGDTVILTITVFNAGLTAVNGLKVKNLLPSQTAFVSATPASGTYAPATGIWTLSAIPAGMPEVKLTIKLVILGDGAPQHIAEIIAMTEPDADSQPNNQIATEDDLAKACLSVPFSLCKPTATVMADPGFASYQWFKSTDSGATYTPFASTQVVNISLPGYYIYKVNNGVLGACATQLCCPHIVE